MSSYASWNPKPQTRAAARRLAEGYCAPILSYVRDGCCRAGQLFTLLAPHHHPSILFETMRDVGAPVYKIADPDGTAEQVALRILRNADQTQGAIVELALGLYEGHYGRATFEEPIVMEAILFALRNEALPYTLRLHLFKMVFDADCQWRLLDSGQRAILKRAKPQPN